VTHAARYAIIRFLPFIEAEEFANIGVIMFAPSARFFDFQLSKKWRRIGAFFESLDRGIFVQSVSEFEEELLRIREQAKLLLERGAGSTAVSRLFDEVVRPREGLFRFSSVRAVLTETPTEKLDRLFEGYVERALAGSVEAD
jgi:Protein of unknown function (DUF3037)